MSINAAQHIYTNVEKEKSPNGIGGFQTLFYSKSALSEDEIDEIEGRLLYFPSKGDEVKHVFFTTSSGKVVLGQVVALPEPDSAGRMGRYFAHSLILTREAFLRIGADPFCIFGSFPFMTTVEEAAAHGNSETGDMELAALENVGNRQKELDAAKLWPQDGYRTLAFLALRAEQLAADRASVTVLGDSSQVEGVIRAALLAVPRSRRTLCTFDTYFAGCNPVATHFWAVGLPEVSRSAGIVVDPTSRQISDAPPATPLTSYERWIAASLGAGSLAALQEHRETAFALCEWLDGRAPEPPPIADSGSNLIEAVFRSNSDVVRGRLQSRLCAALPRQLAEWILPVAYARYQANQMLTRLCEGFTRKELTDLLYEAYSRGAFRSPEREELRSLGEWLGESDHRGLHILLAWWGDRRDKLHEELRSQTEDEYKQFLSQALRSPSAAPMLFFLPEKAAAFFGTFLPTVRAGTLDILALAQVLLQHGNSSALGMLTDHVAHMNPGDLRALKRLIEGRPEIPPPFAEAVSGALDNVKPGVITRFLRKYISPTGEEAQKDEPRPESEKHNTNWESGERSDVDDRSK